MAEEQTPQEAARNQVRVFRSIIANVVGELRSQAIRSSYASVTLAELCDRHLVALVSGEPNRPSRKQRLDATVKEFRSNLAAIKATSPDQFKRHDPQGDVNTAP
jgi:hypothetical protein